MAFVLSFLLSCLLCFISNCTQLLAVSGTDAAKLVDRLNSFMEQAIIRFDTYVILQTTMLPIYSLYVLVSMLLSDFFLFLVS